MPIKANCFVIQPFGVKENSEGVKTNNNAVFNALKALQNIDPEFPIKVCRADTQHVKRENLHSHVTDCIKESHFCIVDVNGQNPNVLYELGYARGTGRKVIVLCHNKDEIPGDLNGIVYVEYNNQNIDGLADMVYPHLSRVRGETAHVFEESLDKIHYLPKRNDELIRDKMLSAENKIDILQTNLSIINYDFLADIETALKTNPDLEIRILTLDPQSIFVNFRAQQLRYNDAGIFRMELVSALNNVAATLNEYGDRVRIKTYDDFPAQIAFFFDNQILSCVVSSIGRSRDNCAFIIPEAKAGARKSFNEHFDKLWNSARAKDYEKKL